MLKYKVLQDMMWHVGLGHPRESPSLPMIILASFCIFDRLAAREGFRVWVNVPSTPMSCARPFPPCLLALATACPWLALHMPLIWLKPPPFRSHCEANDTLPRLAWPQPTRLCICCRAFAWGATGGDRGCRPRVSKNVCKYWYGPIHSNVV